MLDNDGRSCVACGLGKWGINCANDCACSSFGSSSCDAKIGCICKAGLTGQYCDKDVDECTSGLLQCTSTEKCMNTYGSALCQCIDGYTRVGDGCQGQCFCLIISHSFRIFSLSLVSVQIIK
uniref:EGF-like domain-containing protein n=1 Tax=Biomphalaria glabrata TaxID=6526 RepID=A0A2C9LZA2_BIOGL